MGTLPPIAPDIQPDPWKFFDARLSGHPEYALYLRTEFTLCVSTVQDACNVYVSGTRTLIISAKKGGGVKGLEHVIKSFYQK